MKLEEILGKIKGADAAAMEQAGKRWKSVAKPLFSLGKLEDAVIRIAGIRKTADVVLKK